MYKVPCGIPCEVPCDIYCEVPYAISCGVPGEVPFSRPCLVRSPKSVRPTGSRLQNVANAPSMGALWEPFHRFKGSPHIICNVTIMYILCIYSNSLGGNPQSSWRQHGRAPKQNPQSCKPSTHLDPKRN
jgi:hypothetical protein